jgi:hypothetical protein
MRWQRRGLMVGVALLGAVSFGLAGKPDEDAPKAKGKDKDKQVVTSRAGKRACATAVNFKKALGLPFDSLGTLGARIEAARRKPDPVALAHLASELGVAEKVSKKKASLTSKALLGESAELARLRRQAAELKAVYAVHQQIAAEETKIKDWDDAIALADKTAKDEADAVRRNKLPGEGPRWILLNNYTTQYVDLWVNGNYKMQVPPGGSKWCVVEHKWNPTVLKAYGSEDDTSWGPRPIYGAFKTYTWNLQGG